MRQRVSTGSLLLSGSNLLSLGLSSGFLGTLGSLRGGTLRGDRLDLLDDALTARGSLSELGLDASHHGIGGFTHLTQHDGDLLLDFLVVLPGFLRGVHSVVGSSVEFLLNGGFFRVDFLQLFLLVGLGSGQRHKVMLLCLLLDRGHELVLAHLSTGELLGELLLGPLLVSLLLRSLSLSDLEDLDIVAVGSLLNAAQLLVSLG